MHKLSKFLHKDKGPATSSNTQAPATNLPSLAQGSVSEQDLYRYRKQRGVNLGSWFVLERWISDGPFRSAKAPGQSDLDVARGSNAKQILEAHWDSWITEEDWRFLTQHGINTVRIPIGYYHICGADSSVLQGTDFASYQDVFTGAWSRLVNATQTAHRYGIGVLVDLHAAPGKQNNDAHGGTSSPPAFFKSARTMEHTTHVLLSLLRALSALSLPNMVGIELLNEPAPPSDLALQTWYKDTISALRREDPGIPLYLGECWRTDAYADFVSSQIPKTGAITALDHHLYRCFTAGDTHTPARGHVHALRAANPLGAASSKLGGAVVVGEWSAALNPGSLQGVRDEDAEKRDFMSAQLDAYEGACAGWFWWTYRKGGGRDTGWCWKDAVGAGVFPGWVGLKAVRAPDGGGDGRRDELCQRAMADHSNYWSQYPGAYAHWRFGDGFKCGWDDAYTFLTAPSNTSANELGFRGPWAARRAEEHVREKGGGDGLWEYEHGFGQGVDAARRDFEERCCR